VTQRKNFTKEQKAQVAKFEKAYTAAVNKLEANANKTVSVTGPNGKTTEAKGGDVAGILKRADVQAQPTDNKAMSFGAGRMSVGATGLAGEGTIQGVRQGDSDRNLRIGVTHEGIHGTGANNMWAGQKFDDFNKDHQAPFNRAAAKLIDEE